MTSDGIYRRSSCGAWRNIVLHNYLRADCDKIVVLSREVGCRHGPMTIMRVVYPPHSKANRLKTTTTIILGLSQCWVFRVFALVNFCTGGRDAIVLSFLTARRGATTASQRSRVRRADNIAVYRLEWRGYNQGLCVSPLFVSPLFF